MLRGIEHLYLVPHGILHYVPYAALPVSLSEEQSFLFQEFTLTYLPTAMPLDSDDIGRARSASLLSVAPSQSRLRYASTEARAIDAMFRPNSRLLIGDAATETGFKKHAGDYRLLHLATHSDFNRLNPMFSGLQLEPDDLNDGRLEVHEVLQLELDADLVTLSACDTALGSGYFTEVPAGDEFVGLTRAFLAIGSDAVMATLWEVDDRSSVKLMQRFYQYLTTVGDDRDKARALVIAQKKLLAEDGYEHPYFWAPFVVVEKFQRKLRPQEANLEAKL